MSTPADAIEDEDGAVDAGLTKLDPFLGKCDTEAVDPFELQSLSDRHHAVPIRIGLHDCEDLAPSCRAPNHL